MSYPDPEWMADFHETGTDVHVEMDRLNEALLAECPPDGRAIKSWSAFLTAFMRWQDMIHDAFAAERRG